MENNLFSFFNKPITNIIPLKSLSIEETFNTIKSDTYAKITEELRNITNEIEQRNFKSNQLDYVTFSGLFNKRSNNELINHSNLFCVDIDHLNNIEEVKKSIIDKLPPLLMFVSPSGKGLKIVYKIDVNQSKHLDYFNAFDNFFKYEFDVIIDQQCKDVSRACFLCHDKEAYLNLTSTILDKSFIDTFCIEPEKVPQNAPKPLKKEYLNDYTTIIERLKVWINETKNQSFVNGNRNHYITQLAGAYNRYGIPKDIAESDLVNFAETGFSESQIKTTIKSIYKNTQWHGIANFDTNQPYDFSINEVEVKAVEPLPLLPTEGLPFYIQSFINEYVEVYNCPKDYISSSVIFATALAIGNKIELVGKYTNIPLLWLAIVGNVSTGKTEPLSLCLSLFNQLDNEAFKEYKKEKELFDLEQGKKDRDKSIKEPKQHQYILNDYTPEALAKVHEINNRGLCIYRDELKGWLDDFGRYAKSGEQSNMLTSFFRKPIKFNRATKEPINIEEPCIYVSGGIQPDLLQTLANDSRAESGFLSRFLFAYPDTNFKPNYSRKKLQYDTVKNFKTYLHNLLSIKELVSVSLSKEAENLHENWFNENAKISNEEPKGYLKGVYGKLDIYVLRLAVVVYGMDTVCNQYRGNEISESQMQTAIDLTEYFRKTALKVYHKIFANKVDMDKKEVMKYLQMNGASQNEIAKVLKVSQPYVNKILKID
jgi:hypothetical protein